MCEELQVVGQPLVLGDDDALAVHVELRAARAAKDLHHVEHLARDMGRYGEIWGDMGRSASRRAPLGRRRRLAARCRPGLGVRVRLGLGSGRVRVRVRGRSRPGCP